MPTIETVAKWINSGEKNGRKWFNIKGPDDQIFWSDHPITNISQGAKVKIDYTVGRNGSNRIVKVDPITNGTTGPSYRAETSSRDAERMFVTALLKSYIECAAIPLDGIALAKAMGTITQCYRGFYTTPKITDGRDTTPPDEDMNDEIPY